MAARPWLGFLVWTAAVGAVAAAIAAQSIEVASGSAETAAGYTLGGVTLYEGTVTAVNVRTDVLPGCTCRSANVTLDTGAPQLYFDSTYWPTLPAVEVGDHVLVWVACDSGSCDQPPGAWAIKMTSSRTTATSDFAQFSNVNFTPGSAAAAGPERIGAAVLAVLLGLAVVVILLAGEPSPFTALGMAGAMISVTAGHSFYAIETNIGFVFLAAVAAFGFGLAGWLAARSRRHGPGPYAVFATLAGAAMIAASAVGFVLGALFAIAG